MDKIFVKHYSGAEQEQGMGGESEAGLRGRAWHCLFCLCWDVNGGEWWERKAASERWLHWRTEGTTCGSSFPLLINGPAAGSPSVSTTDSADFFLIPVPLSLGGGRQYCRDAVLSPRVPPQRCRGTARHRGASVHRAPARDWLLSFVLGQGRLADIT